MEAPLSFYALQELLTALIEPKVQIVTFMIWNCGNCGAEIDEGTQFCPKCGTKINWEAPQTDQTFTCGNCGGEFKGRVEYCPHCGTNINWESTNNNQNESSERYNLYGMAFVAICAFIAMGIYIYRGDDWFFIILMTVAAIIVGLCFIGYAKEHNIPKNIALPITCFIGFVVLALAINKLNDYWDLQKEIEQRKQETEQKAREQKEAEAERKEREKKEEAEREANDFNKRKEIMKEKGYKAGYRSGFTSTPSMHSTLDPRNGARSYYTAAWGAPVNEEERELFDIFSEEYVKGYEDGYRNR